MSVRTLVPGAAAAAAPAGWGVRRAVRLAFPDPAPRAPVPERTERLRVYLTDLLHPYGLALDAEEPPDRGGHSYGDLAAALIRQAVPAGEHVDLLVLAYAVPDVTPGRATATWLSHVCPGNPLAFAVADQGPAAAFTALRLIHAYAATAALPRALLLTVEQPALPYPPLTSRRAGVQPPPAQPAPDARASDPPLLPDAAYGVALLLGPPEPGERAAGLGSLRAGGATAADVRDALGEGGGVAVLGAGVDGRGLGAGAEVRRAAAGRPGTGVWWELAGVLAAPPAGPCRVVLADRAPGSGGLALAAVDVPAVAVWETAAAGARR
ncbi:hypothetical protein [Streptomyces sp. NRRL F-5123]|uniref:hypothetical protein n=1 Tax=Streptomyces sp. NRRL F-5123 TaxID=1463856 RepID=UPI0006945E72|nr:hypothetical protein [Streptomyces sp. NRRL F-5123]